MDPTKNNDSLLDRINVLINSGAIEQAASLAAAVLARDPTDKMAIYAEAYVLERKGDYIGALAIHRKIIQGQHTNAEMYANIGFAALRAGFELAPKDKEAANHLFEEAYAANEQAYDLDPKNTAIVINTALSAATSGHYKRAIAMFERYLTLAGDNPTTLTSLGDTYMLDHQFDNAMGPYQRALAIDPNTPNARANLAKCYLSKGDLIQAAACMVRKY